MDAKHPTGKADRVSGTRTGTSADEQIQDATTAQEDAKELKPNKDVVAADLIRRMTGISDHQSDALPEDVIAVIVEAQLDDPEE